MICESYHPLPVVCLVDRAGGDPIAKPIVLGTNVGIARHSMTLSLFLFLSCFVLSLQLDRTPPHSRPQVSVLKLGTKPICVIVIPTCHITYLFLTPNSRYFCVS